MTVGIPPRQSATSPPSFSITDATGSAHRNGLQVATEIQVAQHVGLGRSRFLRALLL